MQWCLCRLKIIIARFDVVVSMQAHARCVEVHHCLGWKPEGLLVCLTFTNRTFSLGSCYVGVLNEILGKRTVDNNSYYRLTPNYLDMLDDVFHVVERAF